MCQPFCILFCSVLIEGQSYGSFQGIYSENAVYLTLYWTGLFHSPLKLRRSKFNKVKFTLEETMKNQTGIRGIALPFL
jgi:hypothetical protein